MLNECRVGLARVADDVRGGSPYSDTGRISALVRDAAFQCGLGQADPQAPMLDIIRPGMTVLLKPNWVYHQNLGGGGMECLVTHPSFILAVLAEVCKAGPGKVIISDAPIQGCEFDALVTPEWRAEALKIANCPVEIIDFRRTVLRKEGLASGQDLGLRGMENYILFDLAGESLLEPVSTPAGRFRITCYDPDQMAERHRPGRHQYLLCREPFEADVVVNLPKLKCHKKAGMTGALKNLVGMNGNKEYLPHHRVGGTAGGGDCYTGLAPLKRMAEFCLDEANRRIGTKACALWQQRSNTLRSLHGRIGDPEIEGGWHGNDTVWRMVLDLNRLLLYGRSDGTLSETPLRKVYTITDAIVAGELDGPLAPSPVLLGAVTFAVSSAFADVAHSALMHFDPEKIPLVREAFGRFRYPLTGQGLEKCEIHCGGRPLSWIEAGALFGGTFRPPAGWKGHIENQREMAA
jgi:uncharacterized protein (DUF362 family)